MGKLELNSKNKMKKEEKILDQLLLFMKAKISREGVKLDQATFDFRASKTKDNPSNEIICDGESLAAFKRTVKSKNHNLIVDALNIAITEGYIKDRINEKYRMILLTEKGSARAKSFKVNEKMIWKKGGHYFMDKICIPLVVAIAITLITNHLNQQSIDKEIESLKKEIKWIKEQQ
ncbi:MAG: hypothetical protein ACJAZX_001593 [Rickettsiales bacterium]